MKPRQLIIVHGPPVASQDLAESCKAFSGKDIKVYMPKLQETVDATSETHIYQVITLSVTQKKWNLKNIYISTTFIYILYNYI